MFKTRSLFTVGFVGILAVLGWLIYQKLTLPAEEARRGGGPRDVPVEVEEIVRGPVELRRIFVGSLEARTEFVVSPKVGGRIRKLLLDIGDPVQRDAVVARLDDDEYQQAVVQAEADLAVANATKSEAASALEISGRAQQRMETLHGRGVASDSQLDVTSADRLAQEAKLAVAEAQVTRAKASLESAKIRLGYTTVTAGWTNGDGPRVVGERFVDEGDTVSANTPLLTIVEMDPLLAVVFVTERDFSRLAPGQSAKLSADAWPGEVFTGSISRIAPIFRASTRQARVELTVPNPGHRLKPGMFVRATVVLDRVEDAVVVPYAALAQRDDQDGVFLVAADGKSVSWRPVRAGIRDGDRLQVIAPGPPLTGRVVTLGQQLVEDGTPIRIPTPAGRPEGGSAEDGNRKDS